MATETFADLLKASMTVRALTRAQLAAALGVDPSQVTRYLAGTQHPDPPRMATLAVVLGWDDATRVRAFNLIAREW